MSDWATLLAQGGGGLAVLTGLAYAMLRMLRQDDEWRKIVDAKNGEIDRLRSEVLELRERIWELENDL